MLGAALDVFEHYSYTVPGDDAVPDAPRTLGAIAARFYNLSGPEAIAAAAVRVARANQVEPQFLKEAATLKVGQVEARVEPGDSLKKFADRYTGVTPLAIAEKIQEWPDALLPGAQLMIPQGGNYTVGKEDSLDSIAARFFTTPRAITGANPRIDWALRFAILQPLPAGKALVLPELTYTTIKGDTLAGIAEKYGTTAQDIAIANPDADWLPLRFSTHRPLPIDNVLVLPKLTHTTREGDTLAGIADKYGTTAQEIAAVNPDVPWVTNADSTASTPIGETIALPALTRSIRAGDTLQGLSDHFGTTPQAIAAANPGADWLLESDAAASVPVGETITLPQITYIVRAGDTLRGDAGSGITIEKGETFSALAARLGLSGATPKQIADFKQANPQIAWPANPTAPLPAGEMVYRTAAERSAPRPPRGVAAYFGTTVSAIVGEPGNSQNEALLRPLMIVPLDGVIHSIEAGQTLLSIAQTYGVTIDQLARNNLTFAGLDTVLLPNCELLDRDDLRAELTRRGALDQASSAAGRFLLNGLRLPDPGAVQGNGLDDPATWPGLALYPLYTLTGQQWMAPETLVQSYTITLAASGQSPPPAPGSDAADQRPLFGVADGLTVELIAPTARSTEGAEQPKTAAQRSTDLLNAFVERLNQDGPPVDTSTLS
ncbi:MAG TPA: LysM peptidoglycan-binding domain-containing protein, partial [Dongiaceae bacterium]|nr:LysM peptidoglycan-binding domain-containing protein [Dongiaceae bacterium]